MIGRVSKIIADDAATFYRYGSGERLAVWPRLAGFIAISLIIAQFVTQDLKDFLNGAIPVQAILIGFSFSVMFGLVNTPAQPKMRTTSIEKRVLHVKLDQLSREIFFNLSYFNLAAMLSLAFALLLLIPHPYREITDLLRHAPPVTQPALSTAYAAASPVLIFLTRSCLFFLLLESGYSFARTVGRVNYLFEQKLALASPTQDASSEAPPRDNP